MDAVDKVASMLLTTYPDYYSTVHNGYIRDAVLNSLADNFGKPYGSLEELHQHIKENYI